MRDRKRNGFEGRRVNKYLRWRLEMQRLHAKDAFTARVSLNMNPFVIRLLNQNHFNNFRVIMKLLRAE